MGIKPHLGGDAMANERNRQRQRRRERNWRGPGDFAKGTVRYLCPKGNRTYDC